jgi:tripartite-type tricarboxylate transporter receptor subunit TctC
MNDVMSGLVPLVLDGYAGLAPAIKGNLIKGVAATSLKRLPGFESLPTVAETVPEFFVGAWTILLAPIGTPTPIIQKIHDDMQKVLDEPEIQAKLALNGGFVRHMTPDEVTAFVNKEQSTWRPIMEQVAKEATK